MRSRSFRWCWRIKWHYVFTASGFAGFFGKTGNYLRKIDIKWDPVQPVPKNLKILTWFEGHENFLLNKKAEKYLADAVRGEGASGSIKIKQNFSSSSIPSNFFSNRISTIDWLFWNFSNGMNFISASKSRRETQEISPSKFESDEILTLKKGSSRVRQWRSVCQKSGNVAPDL